jgi:hypothetical protein
VATLEIKGLQPPSGAETPLAEEDGTVIEVPKAKVKAADGVLRLVVTLDLPKGFKLNARAPLGYRLAAGADDGPLDRQSLGKPGRIDPPATTFEIPVKVASPAGNDTLRLSVTFFYCQEGAEALCKAASQVLTIPIELDPQAAEDHIPITLAPPETRDEG